MKSFYRCFERNAQLEEILSLGPGRRELGSLCSSCSTYLHRQHLSVRPIRNQKICAGVAVTHAMVYFIS